MNKLRDIVSVALALVIGFAELVRSLGLKAE